MNSTSCYYAATDADIVANMRRDILHTGLDFIRLGTHPLSGYWMYEDSQDIDPGFIIKSEGNDTFVMGERFYADTSLPFDDRDLFKLHSYGGLEVKLVLNDHGDLKVYRGASTPIGTIAYSAIKSYRWYYIEFKVQVGNTADFEVRVDGQTVISETGLDTQSTSDGQIRSIHLDCEGIYDSGWADFYLCDTTGAAPYNDFLGDVHIETLRPDGDGNRNNWTQLSGLTNYEMVDEAAEDEETSYVYSSTVTDDELYTFTSLTVDMDNPLCVQVRWSARAEDGGFRTMRALCRSSTSEATGDSKSTHEDRYRHLTGVFLQDPNGPTAWTESAINSAEFGVELDA
jgi:hypothetical protein